MKERLCGVFSFALRNKAKLCAQGSKESTVYACNSKCRGFPFSNLMSDGELDLKKRSLVANRTGVQNL
ncbi:MAG: hypothetical protein UT68_C0008G0016 [Parcubacteria group bacterium GW2011_GWC2_40_10]|nr:MAG: hypothetical protein UT25_C0001G0249 [Parcubacteria group bacterium GW2011_GWC1_39_12]KKR34803.1 MAG: hypothetical protein UT68_C0008G0016 [Parcubacteria group bacterium GW2011_GWC2_40_10]KKR52741.1 MAG: hypothetical protein UT89_C0001G0249 [Parcubacteria group bacterium GW2011_GWE1_40_20]KKR81525.1 MAG: hypothetical protein UU27_C0013G0008 [Parcubacteria group bacterium GW2011_GWD1_40_9]KKS36267.1 MAG: hypothetical protein UU99_C0002G0249 [Parcubacteria group bacterium GW2011_GWE2_42_1